MQKRLQEAGFSEDFKKNTVFRNLRGKAIFAARKGKIPLQKGVHLIAAHADSPRLDFKQRPLVEQPGVAQAKTHYYGGSRKYPTSVHVRSSFFHPQVPVAGPASGPARRGGAGKRQEHQRGHR